MNSQPVFVFSPSSESMVPQPFPSVQNLTLLFDILFPRVYLLTSLEPSLKQGEDLKKQKARNLQHNQDYL